MWIYGTNFTVHAVRYNPTKSTPEFRRKFGDLHGQALEGKHIILLRAFTEADIVNFTEVHGDGVGHKSWRILKDDQADYEYRTLMDDWTMGVFMARHMDRLDYDTLKQSVRDREGRNSDRYDMLVQVHAATKRAFDERIPEWEALALPWYDIPDEDVADPLEWK